MKRIIPFLSLMCVLFVSCNRSAKFDKNLQTAYTNLVLLNSTCQMLAETTQKVWNTAIYDNVDINGKYVSDFNEALATYSKELRQKGFYDTLAVQKHEVDSVIKLMDSPPSDRKDAYDDFVRYAADANVLYNLAVSPQGSLQSYSANVQQLLIAIAKEDNEFKLKYSKILNH